MVYLIFAIMELFVIVEGSLAYKNRFLTRSQGRKSTIRIGYFLEHGGMWGDFFLVSPLVAFIIFKYSSEWSFSSVVVYFTISIVASAFMLKQWRTESFDIEDAFHSRGRIALAGWLHYIYMVVALAVIALFYGVSSDDAKGDVYGITFLVCLHVAFGVLEPSYMTYKKLTETSLVTTGVAWFFLLLACLRVVYS